MNRPDTPQGLAAGASVVTVLLTAVAFWLSFEHLHDVADSNGLHDERAWAWPATIDAFILIGELLILRASLKHRVDPWAITLAAVGSLGSIALNVAGVGTHAAPMEYVVAAVPPSAALIAFGALMRQFHTHLSDRATVLEGPSVPVTVERVPEAYPELPALVPAVPKAPPIAPGPADRELTPSFAAEGPRTRPQVHAEYVPDDDEPIVSPDPLTERARAHFAGVMPPSVRRIREVYRVGQARAQRIRDELRGEA